MKPSEFLETLDSHTVYEDRELRLKYKCATGLDAVWDAQSPKTLNTTVGKFKGLIAPLRTNERVITGYRLAEQLERILAGTDNHSKYHGRGSRYEAAIEGLKKAGY